MRFSREGITLTHEISTGRMIRPVPGVKVAKVANSQL